MKYTGINIGPIVSTISMGRKPREIWAASYMFSFLMECIVKEIPQAQDVKIISPAVLKGEEYTGVGLYPDRVFVQGDFDVQSVVDAGLDTFTKLTGIGRDYIKVMHASIEGADSSEDKDSIKRLNQLLDCMELSNHAVDAVDRNSVLALIQKKDASPLFIHGHGKLHFSIPFLAEIASGALVKEELKGLCNKYRGKDSNKDGDEDDFYQELKSHLKKDYFSFYKYVCIVQADGDNMGKIVSSITADKVKDVSDALLEYGKEACKEIKKYGGLPVYAGGDDLLFIAPVMSKEDNIFDLMDRIDALYKKQVDDSIEKFRPEDKDKNALHTYLSYGLSISYYKYPLYEAFQDALNQLFGKAKNVDGKNAVAWRLRKHSGSGFVGSLSKNGKIYSLYKDIMNCSVEEKVISAIAHKLKNNENLLGILLNGYRNNKSQPALENRLENFYKKTMEDTGNSRYMTLSRSLLCELMMQADAKTDMTDILENMYGMLRTAKFINGEGDKDE